MILVEAITDMLYVCLNITFHLLTPFDYEIRFLFIMLRLLPSLTRGCLLFLSDEYNESLIFRSFLWLAHVLSFPKLCPSFVRYPPLVMFLLRTIFDGGTENLFSFGGRHVP